VKSAVLDQHTNAQMQGTAQPAQALPTETHSHSSKGRAHSTRQLLVRYLASIVSPGLLRQFTQKENWCMQSIHLLLSETQKLLLLWLPWSQRASTAMVQVSKCWM